MDISKIQKNWNDLADEDAMWTVLTDPDKKGGLWKPEEFFETGRKEIAEVMAKLAKMGLTPETSLALDFGCGVGRLSQALGEKFQQVHGVDVSSSMIAQANKLNHRGAKVRYFVNARTDLADLSNHRYDFIYSNIALQHIPTNYQKNYISDFLKFLKPGGVAVFSVVHAVSWRKFLPNTVAELGHRILGQGKAFIPMYGISTEFVKNVIQESGCELKEREVSKDESLRNKFEYCRYIVRKVK